MKETFFSSVYNVKYNIIYLCFIIIRCDSGKYLLGDCNNFYIVIYYIFLNILYFYVNTFQNSKELIVTFKIVF